MTASAGQMIFWRADCGMFCGTPKRSPSGCIESLIGMAQAGCLAAVFLFLEQMPVLPAWGWVPGIKMHQKWNFGVALFHCISALSDVVLVTRI